MRARPLSLRDPLPFTASLVTAFLVTTVLAGAAHAQDAPTTTAAPSGGAAPSSAYTGRSITAPTGTFTLVAGPLSNLDLTGTAVEGGLNQIFVQDIEFCVLGVCDTFEIPDPLFALIGLSYSVLDELEIGAFLLNLELSPDVEYVDPAAWARYRILEGEIEVGVQAMLWFPVARSDLQLELGLPVRFRGPVRFDTGLYFGFDTDADFAVRVPATVTANVTPEIFLGGRSGIVISDVGNDGLAFPLQFVGGYTVAGAAGPAADITLALGFPYFIVSGGRGAYDELVTEVFQVSLGANVFFDI